MKVILINGSPHADGSTNRALVEVARELNKEGIETEIIQVGQRMYSLWILLSNRKMCF